MGWSISFSVMIPQFMYRWMLDEWMGVFLQLVIITELLIKNVGMIFDCYGRWHDLILHAIYMF